VFIINLSILSSTSTTQIYTDGSKSEQGVGAGISIFRQGVIHTSLQYRLNEQCTNQAEQLAILRAMEFIDKTGTDRTITIFTDSMVTLDALWSNSNHT
jgi:ribonuclease HI